MPYDPSRPNAACMYDHYLGGKNNGMVDRAAARMRSERHLVAKDITEFRHHSGYAEVGTTVMDPRSIVQDPHGAWLAISALVPGVRFHFAPASPDIPGERTMWLVETRPDALASGSWALVRYRPGEVRFVVEQCGSRRLWDAVRAAYLRWVGWGSPDLDRFGLIVTPVDQRVWLDVPAQRISVQLERVDELMPP
ncbi:hypothetical protein GCM10029978_068210 [Actinoallomurus acanthiterrae]